MRLELASQLLCLPEDLPSPTHLVPDGSVAWQATVAARVETLHRLATPGGGPAAADPFVAGSLRHAALLMLLGQCIDTPEPAALELGLLAELLQAAATGEATATHEATEAAEPTDADFVAEPWRLRAVEAFVTHLRQGDSHLCGATMFGALVPVWRVDSHVVPAIRRWVWCCTTPLAGVQLRQAAAAVSEMFNECAVLLCRLDGPAGAARRDGVMAVAMNMSSIWSVQFLHALRRHRRASAPGAEIAADAADAQFDRACRRELASCTVAALRAVARLDVGPALQRALRVFCSRQYDLASRSIAAFVPLADCADAADAAGATDAPAPGQDPWSAAGLPTSTLPSAWTP